MKIPGSVNLGAYREIPLLECHVGLKDGILKNHGGVDTALDGGHCMSAVIQHGSNILTD
jgi:hypothetical protein